MGQTEMRVNPLSRGTTISTEYDRLVKNENNEVSISLIGELPFLQFYMQFLEVPIKRCQSP